MPPADKVRVGYVLKMYPRLAETFILNEILAHQVAGHPVDIFSLRSPVDGRFHHDLARVESEVTYVPGPPVRAEQLWETLGACRDLPGIGTVMDDDPPESGTTLYQALHVALAVRQRGITLLHAHFATLATNVARLAARLAGIPYTFTAHAKDIFHEDVDEADLRRKLRDAAAVVTVSDFNVRWLRERFGDAAARVTRIYNGLDLDLFPYAEPSQRPPVIIGVGRLVEKKGFGDLVEACAILKSRGCGFACDIVGGGALRGELAARIDALGVGDRVRLLGPRPRNEVAQRVQAAAVMAAPCVVGTDGNRDGLPTVLLEAMALGTPCVSTPVTGIPELVRHGRTGLLVGESDPAHLADALQRLLTDEALRVELARDGRRLIEAEFDVCRATAGLRRLFQGPARPEAPEVTVVAGVTAPGVGA